MTKQFLVYGTVTKIFTKLGSKVPRIALSTGHELAIENGTRDNDTVTYVANNEFQTIKAGQAYFISCNQKSTHPHFRPGHVLFVTEANRVYDTKQVKQAHHAMKDAAYHAVKSLKALNARDRVIVLQCAGIALTGSVSFLSAVTATAEVLNFIGGATFEPTTLVTSLGLSGLTGFITAMQYDSLSQNLKDNVEAVKYYKSRMTMYQREFKRHIPASGLDGTPLNPALLTLIEDLRPMFVASTHNMRRWWNAQPQAAHGVA